MRLYFNEGLFPNQIAKYYKTTFYKINRVVEDSTHVLRNFIINAQPRPQNNIAQTFDAHDISRLTPDQACIYVMRIYDKMSFDQISFSVQIPVSKAIALYMESLRIVKPNKSVWL